LQSGNSKRFRFDFENQNRLEESLSLFLINDRQRRKNAKRYVSIHVGSRWYRSPEVSLDEK
jgi:hypothetical protein